MRRLLCVLCALLLLCGCTPASQGQDSINIVTTTYPTYLAALAVTEGVEGVSVFRLDTGSVSCLHDYTLTVNDMKKLSRADIIIMNGAGMEAFMADALATSDAAVIDCSRGVTLLPAVGHHDHDHGDEADHFDSHYWMNPSETVTMVDAVLTELLLLLDPQYSAQMVENASRAQHLLRLCRTECQSALTQAALNAQLITFHDGFAYFAEAFDLPLLASIEEEAGSEASAKEIVRITQLVRQHELPAIFTEVNGSDATAKAISRETGCAVLPLSMIMDGREPCAQDSSPVVPYIEAINLNIATIIDAFSLQEVE